MNLNVIGLCLDLIGVGLLGLDLIRIQRRLRREAASRLIDLELVVSDYGGVEEWIEDIAKGAYWTEFDYDEGRMVPMSGTFDPDAAQNSFKDAAEAISTVSKYMHSLSSIITSSIKSDQSTANISVLLTYIGLFLIVSGFGLQIFSGLGY